MIQKLIFNHFLTKLDIKIIVFINDFKNYCYAYNNLRKFISRFKRVLMSDKYDYKRY